MPIYEYRCASCGFQSEYLQKVSDPQRSVCPECGQATFIKLVTAAGFQLKGSGWYATDFKGKGTAPGPTEKKQDSDSKPAGDAKAGGDSKPAGDAKAGGESKPAGDTKGSTASGTGTTPSTS
jgi:putative FmdB family regulatory protein